MTTDNLQLVGVNEAAGLLGMSHWNLRVWAYKGRIASVKIGRRLLFQRSELERVVAESTRPRLQREPRVRSRQSSALVAGGE